MNLNFRDDPPSHSSITVFFHRLEHLAVTTSHLWHTWNESLVTWSFILIMWKFMYFGAFEIWTVDFGQKFRKKTASKYKNESTVTPWAYTLPVVGTREPFMIPKQTLDLGDYLAEDSFKL